MLPVAAVAQIDAFYGDARTEAMGGCYVRPTDSTVSVYVGWRQGFAMKGMATRLVGLHAPIGDLGHGALRYSGFGDIDYSEQQLAAGYALSVAPWLNIMVYGLYSRIGTLDAHYETQRWLDAGGGIAAGGGKLWGYALAGSRSWSDSRPWRLRAGFNYSPIEQLTTAVAISCEQRTRLRCGMEYSYDHHIFLRTGLATNPVALAFGVGYHQRHYHIDLATEVHSHLGLSPHISLGLCL